MKTVVRVILSLLFTFFVPALIFAGMENLDSPTYATGLFLIAVILSALFFIFSGYGVKVQVIISSLACLILLSMLFRHGGANYNRGFMNALHGRFPDVAVWNSNAGGVAQSPGSMDGSFIFYDSGRGFFNSGKYNSKHYATNIEDISVIAFYSKENKITGSYRDEKSGEKYADATIEKITIRLFDAKTKAYFAQQTFDAPMTKQKIEKGGSTSNAIHISDRKIMDYIEAYFK